MRKSMTALAAAAAVFAAGQAGAQGVKKGENMQQTMQVYKAKEFAQLSGVPGFSAQLVANHMKLYQGYVNNTNALAERLAELLEGGKEKTPEYAELKRRFGWEFNGMRMHELYFGNLGGPGAPRQSGRVYKEIQEQFGGFDAWKKDFAATGLMRGIGWAALYRDDASGRLFNAWINEHDGGHLAGCTPLLIMDVFEHAYLTDYQLDRARYIEAFFAAADWEAVERRLPR